MFWQNKLLRIIEFYYLAFFTLQIDRRARMQATRATQLQQKSPADIDTSVSRAKETAAMRSTTTKARQMMCGGDSKSWFGETIVDEAARRSPKAGGAEQEYRICVSQNSFPKGEQV